MTEGVKIGTAYLEVMATAKGAVSQVEREFGGAMPDVGKRAGGGLGSGFLGSVGKIAGPLAALFAVDKIKDFFTDANAEARESQKVGATTSQIIKQTGGVAKISADQVGDLATAISNKSGVDDEAIQSGANLLLTFKNVRNEAGAGNDVFNRATQAAVDLSAAGFGSITGASKMLGKALNDPVKGISALGRAGVTFTDQQKDQIKTLVASGDTLSAQKIIMKEVESQVGGVAAKSATAGEKLSTAFANFKESVGTALLPILDKVEGFVTTKVLPALSVFVAFLVKRVGPVFSVIGRAVKSLFSAFAPKSVNTGGLQAIMTQTAPIQSVFRSLVSFVVTKFLPAARGIGQALARAFAIVKPIVLQVVGVIMERVRALAPTFRQIFSTVSTIVVTVMGIIKAVITRVFEGIRIFWNSWGGTILKIIGSVFTFVVNVIKGALNIIAGVVQLVLAVITGDWSGAGKALKRIVGGIVTILVGAWKLVAGVVGAVVSKLVKLITSHFTKFLNWGKSVFRAAVALFEKYILDPIRAARDKLVGIRDAIVAKLVAFISWIKGAFKAGTALVEKYILDPVRQARDKLAGIRDVVKAKFKAFVDWAATTLKTGLAKIEKYILDPVRSARDALKGILDKISSKFSAGVTAIGKAWDGLKAKAKAPVKFVVDTVLNNGLIAAFNKIAGAVGVNPLPRIDLPGFDQGGYTGPGGRLKPAGLVHAGEYVFDQDTVKAAGGPGVFDQWRSALKRSKERLSRPGDIGLPGFSIGGFVKALGYAKEHEGHPYEFGTIWDCSGFMASLQNIIYGKAPARRWATPAFAGGPARAQGFTRNRKSAFMIGVDPRVGKFGHTAGTLLGHRVEESGGVGLRVDGGARGYDDSYFPLRYGLDEGGGLLGNLKGFLASGFESVASWLASLLKGPLAKLTELSSNPIGQVAAQIPRLVASAMTNKVKGFAAGGTMPPGWSLVGEHGPEYAYNPRGGTRVYSASQSEQMGGPRVVIQQTFPQSTDPHTAAAMAGGRVVASLRARGIG